MWGMGKEVGEGRSYAVWRACWGFLWPPPLDPTLHSTGFVLEKEETAFSPNLLERKRICDRK